MTTFNASMEIWPFRHGPELLQTFKYLYEQFSWCLLMSQLVLRSVRCLISYILQCSATAKITDVFLSGFIQRCKYISVLGKEIDSQFPFYSFIQCNFLELSEALFVNKTLDRCGVSNDKHMYLNKSSYCPFESQLQGKVALYCNERRLYMLKT